jgi:hypothetical protein
MPGGPVMDDSSETWIGELPVTARLMYGSERLRLGFTTNRIIVDRIGKRGSGAVIGTSLLGRIGEAVEDLFKGSRESLRKKKIEEMSPDQVLRAHKDNFAISYKDVVNVSLEKTVTLNKITILTVTDKFEFTCTSRFAVIVETFKQRLADKSTVQKLA